jgi:hypothetical protein
MRRSQPSLLAALAFTGMLSLEACAPRYTWVNELDAPGYCAGYLPPASVAEPLMRVAPAVPTAATGRSGAMSGRVECQDDSAPLGWVSVELRLLGAAPDARPVAATTDSTGVFAFEDLPPGRYALRMRRIAFAAREDTLTVEAGRVVTRRVRLAPRALDGVCSGLMMMRVRKPWWRVW